VAAGITAAGWEHPDMSIARNKNDHHIRLNFFIVITDQLLVAKIKSQ
jgi:hypothetical protein